ncbi:MAG: TAXI family TRAP transporter solute-binding subunit [Vicinamibacterales bacterium]
MHGFRLPARARFLASLAALAVWLSSAAACRPTAVEPSEVTLTIATGGQGGAFYPLGVALSELYSSRIPGLVVSIESGGSSQNVRAVEDGRAQIAFTQADVAYGAYRRGTEGDPRPYAQLRGITLLWVNTVHVAVPKGSPIQSIAELRGQRVSVGTRGSGTETLAHIVLDSYALDYDDLAPAFLPFVQTIQAVRDRQLDAAFVVAGLPTAAVSDLAEQPGLRLLPIPRDHVRTMRAQFPFLQPRVVPGGTYRDVTEDVETVGVSNLLVCRQDLDERLVYRITRELFDALPDLARTNRAARLIDLEQAPATPIPLHPGAARYFREREITQ